MKDKIIAFLMRRMRVEAAVAVIAQRRGKVLLTKRNKAIAEGGKWCLPGGHINKWERAEEAARRELKEEIGARIEKSRLLFVHEEFVRRIGLHAIVFVFLADISKNLRMNFEVSEYRWFNRKQIKRLDMAFTHKDILNKFWRMRK